MFTCLSFIKIKRGRSLEKGIVLGAMILLHAFIQPLQAAFPTGSYFRIIIYTPDPVVPSSTDIDDYNTFVNAQAAISPNGVVQSATTWYAIGSTTAVDARDNVMLEGGADVPVFRPDGVKVVEDDDDLFAVGEAAETSTHLLATVTVLPSGDPKDEGTDSNLIWTGTSKTGVVQFPLGGDAAMRVTYGNPTFVNRRFIARDRVAYPGFTGHMYGLSDLIYIPEPGTVLLLGSSLSGALLARPRKRGC